MELKLGDFRVHFTENEKQVRRLADMRHFFSDKLSVEKILKSQNPLIYEVYAKESAEKDGLSYAMTVIKPGDIGGEYYMTKGHYHKKPTGELYLGLQGSGVLVLQDAKAVCKNAPIEPGAIVYVPPGSGHRSVNTGDKDLKFLAVYRNDSGHNYNVVEKEGFKQKIMKK